MSSEKYVPKCKPAIKTIGGLVAPGFLFDDSKCLEGLSYQPTPDDIFIVTYPKAGTTWSQYIVWEILNFGAPPPGMNDMLNKHVPFLEFAGIEPVKKLPAPRPIKTHLPYHLQPYHPLAKYIYVARNPKDTCISYYNYIKEMEIMYKFEDGNLDDFFECFLLGEVSYGDWFDHVLSWYEHKDDPNVLFLTYENMKRDPAGNLFKVAKFIGKEYEERLLNDAGLVARILEYTSFQTMKKLEFYMPKKDANAEKEGEYVQPEKEEDSEKFYKVNFFWRGKVGNWKEFLSREQAERLNEMIKNRPRGQEIASLWEE